MHAQIHSMFLPFLIQFRRLEPDSDDGDGSWYVRMRGPFRRLQRRVRAFRGVSIPEHQHQAGQTAIARTKHAEGWTWLQLRFLRGGDGELDGRTLTII